MDKTAPEGASLTRVEWLDLHRRRDRLRLRHLRASDAAPDRAGRRSWTRRRAAGQPRVHALGGPPVLRARHRGRRSSGCSAATSPTARPPPRAGLEHPALCVLGVGRRLRHVAPMLLFFRCTTFIGVCVEFVAAVAWLAELFPDPKQREKGAGLHPGVLLARRLHGDAASTPCSSNYGAHLPAITAATRRGATR